MLLYLDDVFAISADLQTYISCLFECTPNTNASDYRSGAVLFNIQGENSVLVAYYNKALSIANKNYCTTRKVLQAGVKVGNNFLSNFYEKHSGYKLTSCYLYNCVSGPNLLANLPVG